MVKKIKTNDTAPSYDMNKLAELDFKRLQLFLEQMGLKSSKKGSKLTIEFDDNEQIDTFLSTLSS